MPRRLTYSFFNRDTRTVAKELLGKILVRKTGAMVRRYRIVETEAYHGHADRASHAHKGLTPRTALMFGPAGHAYIYLIYGMYHCLNIVTGTKGFPAAVLIRAVEPLTIHHAHMNGPGKLCRVLRITRTLNGEDVVHSNKLWVEYTKAVPKNHIRTSPRIGVDYAGEYAHKPWRYYLTDDN